MFVHLYPAGRFEPRPQHAQDAAADVHDDGGDEEGDGLPADPGGAGAGAAGCGGVHHRRCASLARPSFSPL